ncbi:MAG TPA: methionyl-tRNA formyltransferase [Gemmataceae bacterium]|nr:methionyl-tRNA formyltransferase [Gemmataceae bacterium]
MRLVMMGTGTFAEPTFKALLAGRHQVVGLVTNPDRPSGRDRSMLRGMKQVALEHNIPVFQPESINTPEGVAGLQAFQPDLLVVAAYGQILSRDVLAVPPLGGINVHASLLPKYRGAAPIAWAIYHGERQTGVTIIRMSVQLDAGDMLAQEAIDIGPQETTGELEARLAQLGARLAVETVEKLAAGPVQGQPQDKTQATKAPKLTKEHGAIDWTRPAAAVCNQIRAMQPWPTPYTYLHRAGQPPVRLIVLQASPAQADARGHAPGELVPTEDQPAFRVAAGGNTAVDIASVQPAGKRAMRAEEFLRGHRLQPGDRLGPETP